MKEDIKGWHFWNIENVSFQFILIFVLFLNIYTGPFIGMFTYKSTSESQNFICNKIHSGTCICWKLYFKLTFCFSQLSHKRPESLIWCHNLIYMALSIWKHACKFSTLKPNQEIICSCRVTPLLLNTFQYDA